METRRTRAQTHRHKAQRFCIETKKKLDIEKIDRQSNQGLNIEQVHPIRKQASDRVETETGLEPKAHVGQRTCICTILSGWMQCRVL